MAHRHGSLAVLQRLQYESGLLAASKRESVSVGNVALIGKGGILHCGSLLFQK